MCPLKTQNAAARSVWWAKVPRMLRPRGCPGGRGVAGIRGAVAAFISGGQSASGSGGIRGAGFIGTCGSYDASNGALTVLGSQPSRFALRGLSSNFEVVLAFQGRWWRSEDEEWEPGVRVRRCEPPGARVSGHEGDRRVLQRDSGHARDAHDAVGSRRGGSSRSSSSTSAEARTSRSCGSSKPIPPAPGVASPAAFLEDTMSSEVKLTKEQIASAPVDRHCGGVDQPPRAEHPRGQVRGVPREADRQGRPRQRRQVLDGRRAVPAGLRQGPRSRRRTSS